MKVTIAALYEATIVLEKVVGESRGLPIQVAYRLARLYRALEPEKNIIDEQRRAKIRELGTESKDADGMPKWAITEPQQKEAYQAWWQELAKVEIEVACEPVPMSAFTQDTGHIEAHEFYWLDPFFNHDRQRTA